MAAALPVFDHEYVTEIPDAPPASDVSPPVIDTRPAPRRRPRHHTNNYHGPRPANIDEGRMPWFAVEFAINSGPAQIGYRHRKYCSERSDGPRGEAKKPKRPFQSPTNPPSRPPAKSAAKPSAKTAAKAAKARTERPPIQVPRLKVLVPESSIFRGRQGNPTDNTADSEVRHSSYSHPLVTGPPRLSGSTTRPSGPPPQIGTAAVRTIRTGPKFRSAAKKMNPVPWVDRQFEKVFHRKSKGRKAYRHRLGYEWQHRCGRCGAIIESHQYDHLLNRVQWHLEQEHEYNGDFILNLIRQPLPGLSTE